jgi:diguanylate cyclase (GGDEF)-like protein
MLAERVRAAIEQTEFDVGAAASHSVTMSVGVAAFGEGQRVETLVAAADEALYAAKGNGRNCVATAGNTPRGLDRSGGKTKPGDRARRSK